MAAEVDTFHNGRRQAIYEIGGQELVDLMEKADLAFAEIARKRTRQSPYHISMWPTQWLAPTARPQRWAI